MTDDIEALRREFSDWKITDSTVTANSGPDTYRLIAQRGDDTIVAYSVQSMRGQLMRGDRFVR